MVLPTAIVILGGLVTSTLLTLFVVPSLYLRFGRPEYAKVSHNRELDERPSHASGRLVEVNNLAEQFRPRGINRLPQDDLTPQFISMDGVPRGQDFWHRRLPASHLADVVELVDTQDLKS